MTKTFEVALTIPDNAAYTALVALERLHIACDRLFRSDIYVFDVEPEFAPGLESVLETIETMYNPNKHRLRPRADRPVAGEVWVGDLAPQKRSGVSPVFPQGAPVTGGKGSPMPTLRIAGRTLEGVRSVSRFTAWHLQNGGSDVSPAIVRAAATQLLCNPAYQEAIVEQ